MGEAVGAIAEERKGVCGMWIRGAGEEGGGAEGEDWEWVLGGEVVETVVDVRGGSAAGIGDAGTAS